MSMAADPDGFALERPRRQRRGRSTLLTREVHDLIVQALRAGSTWEEAAGAAAVHEDTISRWLERGENYHWALDEDPLTPVDEFEELFRAFYLDALKARWQARVRARATILSLMVTPETADNVRLSAAKYVIDGPRRRIELSGPDGGPIETSDVGDRERAIAERLAARFAEQRAAAAAIEEAEVVEDDEYDPLDAWAGPPDGLALPGGEGLGE